MVLKILALHGYTSNGESFRIKMSAIRKLVASQAEFFFAEAPLVLEPVDMPGFRESAAPRSGASTPLDLVPRGWWRANEDRTVYHGAEESIQYIKELMIKEKFDGVFGFSQGASFAGLLCALLEKPHLYPAFLVHGQPPQPPFEFGIFVGGFKPLDAKLLPLFDTKIVTPTLHVMGNNDFVVVESRGLSLVEACESPRVERHEGGHFVPSSGPWRKFFQSYIASFAADSTVSSVDLPSPSAPLLSKV